MFIINTTGQNINLEFKGLHYLILGWEHTSLPDEAYEYITDKYPQLEMDYDLYISNQRHFASNGIL